MVEQVSLTYQRIAVAIDYIKTHFKNQPTLDEIASVAGISPFHFQRLFTEWAGVSPKKFTQYLSLEYAKQQLREKQSSVLDAAYSTGLSGPSRLHDLFVTIEGMTPGEFKKGGENLTINYSFANSPFGAMMIASTAKGICYMVFEEDKQQALEDLKQRFPKAQYHQAQDPLQHNALNIFRRDKQELEPIKLHLNATPFQLKVWQALLKIPMGTLSTYGSIATHIDQPSASRAVGTAIGRNPIAFLIPCHRVIQSSGQTGGYMWGSTRKSAMIGWEACKRDQ
ncbi:MAG: methylated-DNA--[protein]-cysteine S-methyltransferase [Oceanicoccus sp.]|uniref:bifunctional helix-turn-helix domain-containing protein/methylated-DNA--[protein]-cysteine S-methyltransferase n=1 Tax=Oceanicoccus sp. TaxID=2691044 RepID=UPI00261C1C54|nr:methylated-DNA--[protein]-cysteine S-methyltransferase [Oceanicoccus sp.]MCP3907979.1 methylated-DNA--[protein]-cysteine S-methyltransferase [Oceanicoccus sp.]MDG1773062.1 methylated-DNA--[protein]-cysteine S-methyltransferase [Oceanicoccus sp.]